MDNEKLTRLAEQVQAADDAARIAASNLATVDRSIDALSAVERAETMAVHMAFRERFGSLHKAQSAAQGVLLKAQTQAAAVRAELHAHIQHPVTPVVQAETNDSTTAQTADGGAIVAAAPANNGGE